MRGIKIGSAFDIPIELDLTFLLVLPLFAWLIGSDVEGLTKAINQAFNTTIASGPLTSGMMPWILGTTAAVGLFLCVLIHEFGHSLVAMHYGYEIESIKLWLFGGVANFTEIPENWKQEFLIAIVGPFVSIGLGILSFAIFLFLPTALEPAKFVFGYLAMVNIVLAVFNMLPGFPMDGGRVLRALLARNMPHAKATQLAAEVGKVFAFLLAIFGLFVNLFLVALAFFIYIGAAGESQQTVMKAAFQNVTVRDVMTPSEDLQTVKPDTSVAELMERMFRERHTGYPVLKNGNLIGMVTLEDARNVKEVERDAYQVADVMSTDLETVHPDTDAMEALRMMQENSVGRLPVVDDEGNLVGLISRTDLMTAFNIIQSSGTLGAPGSSGSTGSLLNMR